MLPIQAAGGRHNHHCLQEARSDTLSLKIIPDGHTGLARMAARVMGKGIFFFEYS
jgi:hypothetical protein